ncbi:hypothetical protein GMI69_07420 [Eggerthellaceae bacterium zg-887]|uniref:type III-A CRISPR-associated CARF protein Csm6 n=1 Tax=Xiamenia xianingshaonis TaxID=2682776 RepID=UPI00140B7F96|nr:hypothetical protein [Xiamenia xianingshaonis]NHM16484.1 hypothetical protein [Xiamenia xianingshaonis]
MEHPENVRRVLFSPVGSTDPLSKNVLEDGTIAHHDGSMLHICRAYKPELVVLYFSQEMQRAEAADHRYTESLQLLGEELGYEIEVRCEPQESFATEAHDYDLFYNDFENIIRSIRRNYPHYEILLNVSSGTPSMKTALYLLANYLPFKTHPIQVATPLKKSNRSDWLQAAGGLAEVWKKNADSQPNCESRCTDVEYENLNARMTKRSIRKLIDAYDYAAALALAEDIKEHLSSKTIPYLAAAVDRANQNWDKITDQEIVDAFKLPKCGDALSRASTTIPVGENNPFAKAFKKAVASLPEGSLEAGDENGALSEYLLWMQMKQKREDYADFVRGLTPALFRLMQVAVDDIEGLKIEETGCERSEKGVPKLDKNKIESILSKRVQDKNKRQRLLSKLVGKESQQRTLNSYVYDKIIEELFNNNDHPWASDLIKLRKIEELVRNQAAHEIRGIDDHWIATTAETGTQAKTPYDSAHILETIKRCAGAMKTEDGKRVLPIDWKSYDAMNDAIKNTL